MVEREERETGGWGGGEMGTEETSPTAEGGGCENELEGEVEKANGMVDVPGALGGRDCLRVFLQLFESLGRQNKQGSCSRIGNTTCISLFHSATSVWTL